LKSPPLETTLSGSVMNLAAVMVSVAEQNFKQKQNSKTRRADKLVFRTSPIGSTLLVFENSDFGWPDADFESIVDSLLQVLLPFSSTDISTTQNFPSGLHDELFWQKVHVTTNTRLIFYLRFEGQIHAFE
jgi:hypothetical protein